MALHARAEGGEVKLYSLIFNNGPDALFTQIYSVIKLYMFRATSLPIIRSFLCTFGIVKFHAAYDDRFQAESGWKSHPDSAWKRSSQNCMNLTNNFKVCHPRCVCN